MKRFFIIGFLFSVGMYARGAVALGVFEDFFEASLFLTAPTHRSIGASLLRTDKGETDGSGFYIRTTYPLRSYFLLGLEGSYFVLADQEGISSGFGDFRFLGRATLHRGGKKALYLIGSFRTGSGTREVYPFASSSFDVELGAAFMDTLELFTLWTAVKGGSVHSAPKDIEADSAHDDFLTTIVGMMLPVSQGFHLSLGAAGYFSKGGSREVYFLGLENPLSERMRLFTSFQAEGADAERRLFNFSLQGGVRMLY